MKLRPTVLTRVGLVTLVAATTIGWVALGRISASTVDALRTTEGTLSTAVEVAEQTAAIGKRLEELAAVTSAGLGDSATALAAVGDVSVELRDSLGFLERFSGGIEDLTASLERAEVAIAAVILDLEAAEGDVTAAIPALQRATSALGEVPDQIRQGRKEVQDSITELEHQSRLWRFALVLGTVSLGLLFVAVDGVVRREMVTPASPVQP